MAVRTCTEFRIPAVIVLLLLLLSTSGPSQASALSDEYKIAIYVYGQKRYSDAAALFWDVIQKDKTFAEGYIKYASACWIGGDQDTALRTYWYFAHHFQTHKQIGSVMAFLKKNDRAYDAHYKDRSYAILVYSKAAKQFPGMPPQASKSGQQSSSIAAATPTNNSPSIINTLVQTVRPLKNRPAVSATLEYKIKEALKAYPPELLSLLHRRGCKIWLTPTLIDKEPSYENRQPSGYMEGNTYKDCPGMFYGNGIVVCEYVIGNGFDWEYTPDPIGTLKHELGHAVDHYLGQLSESEEYRHAYRLDSGAITDDTVRNKISYFLQKDTRGQHEAFAELMCAKYGGGNHTDDTSGLMKSHFPMTMKFIDRKIAEFAAKKEDDDD